jgi:hypothetical protein
MESMSGITEDAYKILVDRVEKIAAFAQSGNASYAAELTRQALATIKIMYTDIVDADRQSLRNVPFVHDQNMMVIAGVRLQRTASDAVEKGCITQGLLDAVQAIDDLSAPKVADA